MQTGSVRTVVTTGWIAVVCLAGIAGGVSSVASWAVLIGGAALPPIIMFWRWNNPPQTLSESIREARR